MKPTSHPKRKAILAVSDNDTDLTYMMASLKKAGFSNTFSARDGGKAWSALKTTPIDCVISSLNMVEMTGIGLLKIIRREESLADLPVFLADSAFTKLKVLKAGQSGVTGLFVMPFDTDRIHIKLLCALKSSKSRVVETFEKDLGKGVHLVNNQEYDKAIKVFTNLVNQRDNPEYYYNIGFMQTIQNRHTEAIEAFSKATQLDRLFVKAYEAMAESFRALGREKKAENCLRVAAEIYMDTDRLTSAEEILNQVLESGSKSLNIFNSLGVLYRKKGDMAKALSNYRKALKVHPDEPYIYYNMGRIYLDMKDTTKARAYFQNALDKDHEFKEARQVIKAIDLGMV